MNQNIIYTPITGRNAMAVQMGDNVQFLYHGKPREGTIERVNDTRLTLKFRTPEGDFAFKSFLFEKMGS